ncbi:hypothetical protein DPMN_132842 [Dreissena polymorpha]|uniref:Uncharacterized protein n=1 Tax=Dreissena polymorpha TaxID=45954 RepID=A0A9D4FXF6_DREPO|nr:hypothetical protein DPMN_132726 [Dreissena polymorpha]KAH3804555.1 hypothetical protein DPMN_132842 [Dreissena polymorpha]
MNFNVKQLNGIGKIKTVLVVTTTAKVDPAVTARLPLLVVMGVCPKRNVSDVDGVVAMPDFDGA